MTRGRLITVEGLDGAGKTTLAGALAGALRALGQEVEVLREPGGVVLSERIRALVKDPALTVGPRAEALLYAAARAQLVEERLEPLLAAGRWVLLDRFVDSSLAYQGAGRGLGVDTIRRLNAFATGDLVPDRTLLLRIDPRGGAGARRRPRRGGRPARARAARVLRRRSRPPTTSSPPPSRSGSRSSTPTLPPRSVAVEAVAAVVPLLAQSA